MQRKLKSFNCVLSKTDKALFFQMRTDIKLGKIDVSYKFPFDKKFHKNKKEIEPYQDIIEDIDITDWIIDIKQGEIIDIHTDYGDLIYKCESVDNISDDHEIHKLNNIIEMCDRAIESIEKGDRYNAFICMFGMLDKYDWECTGRDYRNLWYKWATNLISDMDTIQYTKIIRKDAKWLKERIENE